MTRAVAIAALVLSACPSPLRRPGSTDVVVSGSVTWGGFNRRADPLGAVNVTLWSTAAPVKATTAADGAYRLSTPAPRVVTATLSAWAEGFAPRASSLRVGESTELQLSFALEPLEPLDCVDTACTDGMGDLRWSDAPSGAAALGLPLTDRLAPSLPGADTVLAAAAVELDAGAPLSGALRLRVPKSAWRSVVDANAGTGVIEVNTGTLGPGDRAWRPGPQATLRTETGHLIAEAQLDEIREGRFAPGVTALVTPVARGVVAVLGAPAETGCVEGRVSIDGAPAAGLTVLPSRGQPAASDATGAVCFEAPLAPEPQPARVQYAGVVYAATTVPAPTQAGACGSAACRALGNLPVQSSTASTVAPCQISVRVVDEEDRPLGGAIVIGMDDGLTQASFASICGKTGTRCTLTGATDGEGRTSLVVPVQTGVALSAKAQLPTGARAGQVVLSACPREPVTVRAATGRDEAQVTARFTGTTISWTPATPAFRLAIERDGGVVWSLASSTGLAPPVTWPTAPVGSEVVVAPVGAPGVGDLVQLTFDSVKASGVVVRGATSAVRE
ncbi:MAG: hypothetical protein JNJ54_29785 [Myxococcaceae bacterium]|nr:hypothetical protein [Myxococcaceae bacterium]